MIVSIDRARIQLYGHAIRYSWHIRAHARIRTYNGCQVSNKLKAPCRNDHIVNLICGYFIGAASRQQPQQHQEQQQYKTFSINGNARKHKQGKHEDITI